jgi:hypothetical protein
MKKTIIETAAGLPVSDEGPPAGAFPPVARHACVMMCHHCVMSYIISHIICNMYMYVRLAEWVPPVGGAFAEWVPQ